MIGQFTIYRYRNGRNEAITVALNPRLQWECDDAWTLRMVKARFPAEPGDDGPAAGGCPGAGMLHRAAAYYEVEPYYFVRPTQAVDNQTD